ncbi:MAG: leucine-rich repeat domain-containing protein [Clostridiales bacterium]|nr:leucine-rich repeat domain-containing protein [Clostridiales bacterium]
MIRSACTSAQTERATFATRLRRALIALLLLALVAMLGGCDLLKDRSATELTIDDAALIDVEDLVKYEELQLLDIRNALITPEKYLSLQSALPNCRILWSVPLLNQRFDCQLTQIVLPADTDAAALELLRYFPGLTTVDARACTCYDALMSKSLERKDISFTWQVEIGGVTLLNSDTALDLSGKSVDADELMTKLYYLPALTSADITDTSIGEADGAALEARYPNISFLRTLDFFGVKANTNVTALDLTAADITDETELLDKLALLKELTSCDLTGRDVSFETMTALEERYPLVAFSFSFELFGQQLTPETTELNLQGQTFTSAEEVAEGLIHLPNLTLCDMCGTGLTDEQMMQLRSEFPDVKFVWLITIGSWQVRTDIEAFTTQNRKAFPNGAGEYVGGGHTKLTDEDTVAFEYCTDLAYLDLNNSRITDLSFVQYLPKLRLLCVANNKITDISALASLSELEFLEIYINYIPNLSPLAGLTKLTSLNCSRTSVTDVTPLLGMTQLRQLWIMNNKIEKEDLAKLTEALPDCTVNSRGSNATSGGWLDIELYREFEVKAGLAEAEATPTPEPAATPEPTETPAG